MALDESDTSPLSDEDKTGSTADYEKTTLTETADANAELTAIFRDGVVGAIGGLVGTALMTVVLLAGQSLGAFQISSFATLAQLINLDALAPAVPAGYFIFLGGGMTTWPLLFASVEAYLPGKSVALRGISFGTVLWTGFVIAFHEPSYTGTTLYIYAIVTLLAHWVYGFSLGSVFDYLVNRPETLV